jgi:hypothetical protein
MRGGLQFSEATGPSAVLLTGDEWIPANGMNSVLISRRLLEHLEQARRSQRSLSFVQDVTWCTEAGATADLICHWEATCDHIAEQDSALQALCLYDRSRLPADVLHAALRTHGGVQTEGKLLRNAEYKAPNILAHEPHLNFCSGDWDVVRPLLEPYLALS